MNAALIEIPVVKKNRVKWEKTLLVNSNKVKNFRQDPEATNYTLLYYSRREDRREKRFEFKVAKTVAQVDALLREEPIEQVIPVYVTYRQPYFSFKHRVNRVEYINIDSWVWAYDNDDAVSATLWIEEGAFGLVKLTVSHTISQMNERASISASYSESGI
jgi:hypothetical protein